MYTHTLKTSGQKCFRAAWWPTGCDKAKARENSWPLMMLESGQITRCRADNLKKIDRFNGAS